MRIFDSITAAGAIVSKQFFYQVQITFLMEFCCFLWKEADVEYLNDAPAGQLDGSNPDLILLDGYLLYPVTISTKQDKIENGRKVSVQLVFMVQQLTEVTMVSGLVSGPPSPERPVIYIPVNIRPVDAKHPGFSLNSLEPFRIWCEQTRPAAGWERWSHCENIQDWHPLPCLHAPCMNTEIDSKINAGNPLLFWSHEYEQVLKSSSRGKMVE